jgi:SepF-like predicted cell division protein (DUF552 family)
MPSFGLFRKPKKQEEPEKSAITAQEPERNDVSQDVPVEENKAETPASVPMVESSEPAVAPAPAIPAPINSKTYLKAMPLKELVDLEGIKNEVQKGNILILRITPLATKSIEDVKSAVNDLYAFTESIGGDIARLGEERVVICPKNIRIWREKTPVTNEPLPTAA